MTGAHVIKRIRELDEQTKSAEDRIADEQIRIGNFKRERAALWNDLTPEERKAFEPTPPPAAPAPIAAPAQSDQEQSSS